MNKQFSSPLSEYTIQVLKSMQNFNVLQTMAKSMVNAVYFTTSLLERTSIDLESKINLLASLWIKAG